MPPKKYSIERDVYRGFLYTMIDVTAIGWAEFFGQGCILILNELSYLGVINYYYFLCNHSFFDAMGHSFWSKYLSIFTF